MAFAEADGRLDVSAGALGLDVQFLTRLDGSQFL